MYCNTVLKIVLEGKVGVRRAIGRQYKWEDNIKTWTDSCLSECTNRAAGFMEEFCPVQSQQKNSNDKMAMF